MHSRHRARSLSLSLSLCLSVSLQKVNGFQKNKKYTHTHTNNNISTTLKHQSDTKNLLEHVILAAEKAQLGAAAAESLRIEAGRIGTRRMDWMDVYSICTQGWMAVTAASQPI
jgi:hypothetical protein